MPHIIINECNIYYEIHGTGPETILFSHGLLWSGQLFHKQVAQLQEHYRCVIYDHRGQGQSEVTQSGYDMDQLTEDAVALIEQLALGKVHVAGLSMGGFVGRRLAARRPDLVKSLTLMDTSCQPEPFKTKYRLLTWVVRLFGVGSVKNKVMPIMFGEKFLQDSGRAEERQYWEAQLTQNTKDIVRAVSGVIDRQGVEDEIRQITCPVLIMVGTQDVATVPAKAEYIQQQIPGSQLVYIEGAGHSASIEEPEQINETMEQFLTKVATTA